MDEIFSTRLKDLDAELAQARIDLQSAERLVYSIDKRMIMLGAAYAEVEKIKELFVKKEDVEK